MGLDRETKRLMEAWDKMQGEGVGEEIIPNGAKDTVQPVRQKAVEEEPMGGEGKLPPSPMIAAGFEMMLAWSIYRHGNDSEKRSVEDKLKNWNMFDAEMSRIFKSFDKQTKGAIRQMIRSEVDM